jgi:hypothetical protein
MVGAYPSGSLYFTPASHFHPCLVLADKAVADLTGDPKCSLILTYTPMQLKVLIYLPSLPDPACLTQPA